MDGDDIMIDRDNMGEVSKPIFYGFVVLTSASLFTNPAESGTFLGVAMLSAVSMVAYGISDMLEDDWQRFMDIIAMITLLSALVAGSYTIILL